MAEHPRVLLLFVVWEAVWGSLLVVVLQYADLIDACCN